MEIGTYKYKRASGVYPNIKLVEHTLKVEILEVDGARVRVKFLGYHADGRGPGSISKVYAKNVSSPAPEKIDAFKHYTEIRKPYKDD